MYIAMHYSYTCSQTYCTVGIIDEVFNLTNQLIINDYIQYRQ